VAFAYSNKDEDYDSSCIDTDRISQTRHASPEEADKVCPTMRGLGIFRHKEVNPLDKETPNSYQALQGGGLGIRLTP
jgi:hypothetical protein